MSRPPGRDPVGGPDVVRWGVGCAVAGVALIGMLVLVFLVAFYLEPPEWVQVVAALGLAVGAAALAWLVSSALAQARGDRGTPDHLKPVPPTTTPEPKESPDRGTE